MTDMAAQALALAQEAKNEIANHEGVCAERMGFINLSLARVEKWITWILTTVIMTLLAAVGALVLNFMHSGQQNEKALQLELQIMQARGGVPAPDLRGK
jgi:hypothetical protein